MNGMIETKNRSSRNFDWNLLKSFLAVIDQGSLSAASRTTGISQPTLSRHLDELEKSLGVVLFERGRRGALPTTAALAIIDHAREIFTATQALSLSATGNSKEIRGTVRITASQMVAAYLLPDIIVKLVEFAPEIEIEIVATNAVENLSEREADIALRMVRPIQQNLIARKVSEIQIGTYVHKNYVAIHGFPKNAKELLAHRIIGFDLDTGILDGFQKMGLKAERDAFQFRSDDQISCWQALCAGVGVGFAPNYLAKKVPELIKIGEQFDISPLPVWLATHREIKTNRRIRMVFDYLAKEISELDLASWR